MSQIDREIKEIRKKLEKLEKKQEEEKEEEKEKINDDNKYTQEINTKGWIE